MKHYGGYDVKKLEFIGKGIHGKVYKINDERCLKIFYEKKFYKSELETLIMSQSNNHFPRLYSYGDKYIVREYINGEELDKYLKKNPLTLEMSEKILGVYEALRDVGFSRLDTVLFHIFVANDESLKIIDTARVMKEENTYPRLILEGLKELGHKEMFLEHVKILRPNLYFEWEK